jgi:hypothetical protein
MFVASTSRGEYGIDTLHSQRRRIRDTHDGITVDLNLTRIFNLLPVGQWLWQRAKRCAVAALELVVVPAKEVGPVHGTSGKLNRSAAVSAAM